MRRLESTLVRITSIAVTAAAAAAGAVLVALMVMTTADVVGRKFGYPINGVFDLTHFTVLIMTFLGMAYCGFQGGHVVIELLFKRLGPGVRRVLKRLINLVGSVLFAVIAWRSAVQSIDVRDMNEASQLLEIPYYPFYWLVALGSLLFALVMALRVFVPDPGHEGET